MPSITSHQPVASSSADALGFYFHQKATIRYLTGLASSLFVAMMFAFPALDYWRQGALVGARLFVFLVVFFFCALGILIFSTMLTRVLRGALVLEFGERELIDRRFLRIRRVPYEKIEIFSPPIGELFRPSIEMQAVRAELEMADHVMILCRLKAGHGLKGSGFGSNLYSFSDHVLPLAVDGAGSASALEQRLRLRLEAKIPRFEQLFEVDFEES